MSGGSLDYVYWKVEDAVDRIVEEISRIDYYEEKTVNMLKMTAAMANVTAKLLKEAEWLFSGDNGDESYSRNIQEIITKYEPINYDEFIKT